MADGYGTSVFSFFYSWWSPHWFRVCLEITSGLKSKSAWGWMLGTVGMNLMTPQILLEFGEVFFLRTAICDTIFPFQKTVSPFDDFLPPKKMTSPPPHRGVAGRERGVHTSFLPPLTCLHLWTWLEAARSLAIVVTITSTLHVYIECQLWQIKARRFYAIYTRPLCLGNDCRTGFSDTESWGKKYL
jgi:hypothetical protein